MKTRFDVELPESTDRLAHVLKTRAMQDAVAAMAGRNELTTDRMFESLNGVVTDRLSKPMGKATTEFFADRPVTEAIILAKTRPVLLVQNGLYGTSLLPEIEQAIAPYRKSLVAKINAVGRIELSDHDTMSWCGTGWLIEDDLIITNRHVADIFAQSEGRKFRYRINQRGRQVAARIDFREEHKIVENNEFGIGEILWIAENADAAPDMAVMRVKRADGMPDPLQISSKDATTRQWIGVVGYPAYDDRNDSSLMEQIFGDVFEVKRFAPGQVVTPGKDNWYLTHEATTLGGNSGSAVLDLATGHVLGLHFGGSFKKTNYAVKASVLKKIISKRSWVPVSRAELKVETETFTDKRRTVKSMEDRSGFDAKFLGIAVPIPKAGTSHSVLKFGSTNAIPYTHFSIVMSKTRRLTVVAAENIDGALKIKLKRKDSWGYDPRIPKEAQVGHSDFYLPEPFDKGHQVRRENPGWGSTKEEAQLGEDDSFIYTNAVPQMPDLNQKTWLSLEDYVLDSVKTYGFRVSVFTGPVFRANDPAYSAVQVPLEFWKVVVALDSETKGLLVSAYLLSQEGMMPVEGFRFGAFKTYQVPLSQVEKYADLKFSKSIRDADVFTAGEAESMVKTQRFLVISGPDDIVLSRRRA